MTMTMMLVHSYTKMKLMMGRLEDNGNCASSEDLSRKLMCYIENIRFGFHRVTEFSGNQNHTCG